MSSASIFNNRIYNVPTQGVHKDGQNSTVNTSSVRNPTASPSFTGKRIGVSLGIAAVLGVVIALALRTEFKNEDEKKKYSELVANLDSKDRKKLETLLKNGILLNTNSNDKSSTLDNLHKIITTQRADGLDPKVVLKETITTLANPFVITQQFGDIPQRYVKEVLKVAHKNANSSSNLLKQAQANSLKDGINEQTIDVQHSGDCVAASIEFNLAKKMPAEFARFAQELSSPKISVEKTIQLKNLANNTLDAVWLLNAFEVPYQMNNFNSAKLTLAPDKNAIMRAQIQNSNKDTLERSLVDVLMQSTFMNVGSQQTYNSLTDDRQGKFNDSNKGLIEFEKTFTESVVEDKNKISVTYQIIDENARLTGYETDFNTIKKHLLDSLAMGENVIIGYTQIDNNNEILNGHEITIIGARQEKNGKLTFICNDTDDDNPNPIEYSEDYIIPKIHHAGLPQAVVEKDVQFVDNWVDGVNAYKKAKSEIRKS
ncbi:MAG: hypothetical protein WCG95_05725 [bacterium]